MEKIDNVEIGGRIVQIVTSDYKILVTVPLYPDKIDTMRSTEITARISKEIGGSKFVNPTVSWPSIGSVSPLTGKHMADAIGIASTFIDDIFDDLKVKGKA